MPARRGGVDYRHTVVIAIGREQEFAVGCRRQPRRRGADRDARSDALSLRVDDPDRGAVPVRDIDRRPVGSDGDPERPAADVDPAHDLPGDCIDHADGLAVGRRHIGGASVGADRNAGGLAADRNGGNGLRCRDVHDGEIIAELIGNERLLGLRRANAGERKREDDRPHDQLPLSILVLSASRPVLYSPLTAFTAASSFSSGGGSLSG
jgi:hypothetical protein